MQLRLKIDGMHCGGCSRSVQNVLSKVANVESASVDLATGQAIVTAADTVDAAALIEAVEDAGFDASVLPSL